MHCARRKVGKLHAVMCIYLPDKATISFTVKCIFWKTAIRPSRFRIGKQR